MSEKSILSKEDIKNIASLANLDVSGDVDKLSIMLSDTLDYIKTLQEVDTSNTEETSQVTGLTNVFQDDSPGDSLKKEEALSNAHEEVNGLFSVKAVFDR
jgi:aspartyl/glutamyl-tRNA(Asn/Gln) amidotransferase C subunit